MSVAGAEEAGQGNRGRRCGIGDESRAAGAALSVVVHVFSMHRVSKSSQKSQQTKNLAQSQKHQAIISKMAKIASKQIKKTKNIKHSHPSLNLPPSRLGLYTVPRPRLLAECKKTWILRSQSSV